MTTFTLTLIDVRRVQGYLFNANELRQNLGASLLVEEATHAWVIDHLREGKTNVEWKDHQHSFSEKTIEKDGLEAEVIFMGGANVAILFASRDQANKFTKNYTRTVLLKAPGLDVAVGHTDFDWDKPNSLTTAWEKLHKDVMPKRKEGRTTSQPVFGLAVTAECAFTGLPAVKEMPKQPGSQQPPFILVSSEVATKRNDPTVAKAKDRLDVLLPPEKEVFKYPDDFDQLGGESGRSRFIAVVHADGNGMGSRITSYMDKESKTNRDRVKNMRKFSEALNQAGLKAMGAVCDWVRVMPGGFDREKQKDFIPDRWRESDGIWLHDNYLPLRPIVFGGDDVTFVCEGRLGLTLAVKFLEEFSKLTLPDGGAIYACAGVAIVHSNYPFARAYKLAEDLTREAKHQARVYDPDKQVSLVNYHVSTSGLTLDWDEIQKREFQGKDGDLLLRPLVVKKGDHAKGQDINWRTWEVFLTQIEKFRCDPAWKGRRNKLKELRETLREGATMVSEFTKTHGDLPAVITGQGVHQTGWYGKRCVYFDALEMDDWFIYPNEEV